MGGKKKVPQETTATTAEEHSDMFHLCFSQVIFLPDSAEALHAAVLKTCGHTSLTCLCASLR